MKKAYGYLRVSTLGQVEKYGLASQENEIRKYCESENIELTDIFVDAGITGANEDDEKEVDIGKRTGLLDMLDALDNKENKVDTIVVYETSRLWRDEGTHIFVARELMKRKIKLVVTKDPAFDLYSKDPTAILFNAIIAAVDVYERMTINAKLARGRATKARKDRVKPGGELPYGYKYDEKKQVIIDENEASVVQKIFSMACSNNGYQGIANWLNSHNYKTKKDNLWSRQAVRSILKNDFYISVLSHNEKFWGSQEAIIGIESWKKINPDYDFSEIKD